MGVYVAWPYLSVSARRDSPVCKSQPPVPLHPLGYLIWQTALIPKWRQVYTGVVLDFWKPLFHVTIGCALNSLAHFQSPCQIIHKKWIIDEHNDHKPSNPLQSKPKSWGPLFYCCMCPGGEVILVLPEDPWAVKGRTETPVCPFEVPSPVNLARNVQGLKDWRHFPVVLYRKTNGWD